MVTVATLRCYFGQGLSRNNASQESSWLNKDQTNKQIVTHRTAGAGYALTASTCCTLLRWLCQSISTTPAHPALVSLLADLPRASLALLRFVYFYTVDVLLLAFSICAQYRVAWTQWGAEPFLQNTNI